MARRRQLNRVALAAVCAALAVVPAGARAQGVTAPAVVLQGHLYPKPYGLTYVYGRLRVPDGTPATAVAGQPIALYMSVAPFTTWTQVASLTSDWEGYFTFHTTLRQNASFRAIWQGAAPVQSNDEPIGLPLKLRLRASRHGRLVTFSGNSRPAHPGARVYVQELDRRGRYRTVTSTTLDGASRFRTHWRLRRAGVFRAAVARDSLFGGGASRLLRIRGR